MQRHVEEDSDTGIFNTLTGVYKHFISGQPDSRVEIQLVSINYPHWLAKRITIYQQVVNLIKNDLVDKPADIRLLTYGRILSLLQLAVDANQRAFLATDKNSPDFLGEYFGLLNTMINSASSSAAVDQILAEEDNLIHGFTGSKGEPELNDIKLTCMGDEKKLHEALLQLIKVTSLKVEKEQARAKQELNKSNQIRYDEALQEMKAVYKQVVEDFRLSLR